MQIIKNKTKNHFIIFCLFFVFYLRRKICWAVDDELKCTKQFCEEYVQRFPCPSVDPLCSNDTRSAIIPSPTVCNCCDHCFLFQDEGDDCVEGRPGQSLPNVMCKPGTECVQGICRNKTIPDTDFYRGYECEEGICYCAVIVDDKPLKIFGKFKESPDIIKEKQCECSAFSYQAQKTVQQVLPFPEIFIPVPRCLSNGQYDALQCVDDMCGCVDKTTGNLNFSVRKVPVRALGPGNPKCFDPKFHKVGEYYTICEKERNEVMNELFWGDFENVTVLLSHKVKCSPDGEYETLANFSTAFD